LGQFKLRPFFQDIADLWHDRDVHVPAFKEGVKQLPAKFRAADPIQRRNLLLGGLVLVLLQVLMLSSLF
jgi:hypothetical protein